MNINDIQFPNPKLKSWVIQELQVPGPWQTKSNIKEQVNCLLQFKLSCQDIDSLDIRGYLSNHDSDNIWLQSMQQQVFPFIVNHTPGVYHGATGC